MSETRHRASLLAALSRFRDLHISGIEDLDESFFSRTRFFVLVRSGAISAVAVLYAGGSPPTVLALADAAEVSELNDLVVDLGPRLLDRIYAHLSPGAETVIERTHWLSSCGEHLTMRLADTRAVEACYADDVACLGGDYLPAAQDLYAVSYPGNWFDSRMLSACFYHGVSDSGLLVAVAGIFTWSRGAMEWRRWATLLRAPRIYAGAWPAGPPLSCARR